MTISSNEAEESSINAVEDLTGIQHVWFLYINLWLTGTKLEENQVVFEPQIQNESIVVTSDRVVKNLKIILQNMI